MHGRDLVADLRADDLDAWLRRHVASAGQTLQCALLNKSGRIRPAALAPLQESRLSSYSYLLLSRDRASANIRSLKS